MDPFAPLVVADETGETVQSPTPVDEMSSPSSLIQELGLDDSVDALTRGEYDAQKALEIIESQLKVASCEITSVIEAHLPPRGSTKDQVFIPKTLEEFEDKLKRLGAGIRGAMKRGYEMRAGTMHGDPSDVPSLNQSRASILETLQSVLMRVCECRSSLDNFDAMFARGDLVACARLLRDFDANMAQLAQALCIRDDNEANDLFPSSGRILGALRIHGRRKRTRLRAHLERLLVRSLDFRNVAAADNKNRRAHELRVTVEVSGQNPAGKSAVLPDLLAAMHISGVLTRSLKGTIRSKLLDWFFGSPATIGRSRRS